MGRRKVQMELISNERRRYETYQKRKNGLEKKAYELSTLCDVKVCLIIYGPTGDAENQYREPNIWPEDPGFVCGVIESYTEQSEHNRKIQSLDLSSFFNNLAEKAGYECNKLRRSKHDGKYPTWDERFNSLSSCELRQVISELEVKVEDAKARIWFLKGTRMFFPEPPGMRNFLEAQETEESNPQPGVAQSLVGTSSLQMGSIQQTSYTVNPMMNPRMMAMTMNPPVQYEPYHHDHHLMAAEVTVMKNHVMMGKVEPRPGSLLLCSEPADWMRPYGQNLPATAKMPYGWNLPAMTPYGQYQWMLQSGPSLEMHYFDDVIRRSEYRP